MGMKLVENELLAVIEYPLVLNRNGGANSSVVEPLSKRERTCNHNDDGSGAQPKPASLQVHFSVVSCSMDVYIFYATENRAETRRASYSGEEPIPDGSDTALTGSLLRGYSCLIRRPDQLGRNGYACGRRYSA